MREAERALGAQGARRAGVETADASSRCCPFLELFWYAETAEEIWDAIPRWYERAGHPLLEA